MVEGDRLCGPESTRMLNYSVRVGLGNVSAAIRSGCHEVASEISKSNYAIAESIRDNSNSLITGLSKISDEMKRSTILNETHILMSEIDNMESKLHEMGLIQEVYAKIEISETPLLDVRDEELLHCVRHNPNHAESIQQLMLEKLAGPMEVFHSLIEKHGIERPYFSLVSEHWRIKNWGFYFASECFLRLTKPKKNEKYFTPLNPSHTQDVYACMWYEDYCKEPLREYFLCGEFNNRDEYEKFIHSDHPWFHTWISDRTFYCLWKNECPHAPKGDDEILQLAQYKHIVAEINQDIALNNLRNLHSELKKHYKRHLYGF